MEAPLGCRAWSSWGWDVSIFDLELPAVRYLPGSVAILSIYVPKIVIFWGVDLTGGILGSGCLSVGPGSSDVCVTGVFWGLWRS